jgi:hypothetical protein
MLKARVPTCRPKGIGRLVVRGLASSCSAGGLPPTGVAGVRSYSFGGRHVVVDEKIAVHH